MVSIEFLPLIILGTWALWSKQAVLFVLLAGVSLMTGFASPDIIGNSYNSLGLTVGLSLIGFSFLCCAWAFRLMFWSGG